MDPNDKKVYELRVKSTNQVCVLQGLYDQGRDIVYLPIGGFMLKDLTGQAVVIKAVEGPRRLGGNDEPIMLYDPSKSLADNLVFALEPDGPKSIRITVDQLEVIK